MTVASCSDIRGQAEGQTVPPPAPDAGLTLVQDLADWVGPRRLLELVLKASEEVTLNPAARTCWEQQGQNAQALLSVMLYGFARGIYSSAELSRRLLEDPWLDYLILGFTCRAEDLSRFRRRHGLAIRDGLANVIRGVLNRVGGDGSDASCRPGCQPLNPVLGEIDLWVTEHANARLTWGMRWDSMEADV